MNLIVFDIDGTIVDSVKTDDECFIQSFQDLHDIDLSGANWNDFNHVTDSGLTSEIFDIYLRRQPSQGEIAKLQTYFYGLLDKRRNEIKEVKGAINTLHTLNRHHDICIAFATGGWKKTATLKLSIIGIELGELVLTSANQHISRAEITKQAIQAVLAKQQLKAFHSITYIGDGLWDFETARSLGINFIGVDYHQNNKLVEAGAPKVVPDLSDADQIIKWATAPNSINECDL